MTPLYIASQNGYEEIVRLLLAHPLIEINKASYSERTPLMIACRNRHIKVIELLKKRPELDINKRDVGGATALQIACGYFYRENGAKEIVEWLLANYESDKKDDDLDSCFYEAVGNGNPEIIKILLEVPGININKEGLCEITPLKMACEYGLK